MGNVRCRPGVVLGSDAGSNEGEEVVISRNSKVSFVALAAMLLQVLWVGTALAADPVINSYSPASGPVGSTVTLTGTGFTGVNDVEFNNVNAGSFTVNNDTTITATVPCNGTDGPISVTVPGGGGGTDATDDADGPMLNDFDVVASAPTVTGLNPSSGWGGRSVTITGTGFLCVTAVEFNGTAATFTVVSPTSITTTVPSGATDGNVTVTAGGVTSPNNGTNDNFDVVAAPAPTVSSFNPTSGPPGTSVVISGSGFTGATAVRFGGVNSTFTVNNDGQITATVPNGADTGAISVVTPAGTGVCSSSFNVVVGGPVITSFTPTSGVTGTSVQINGDNFTGTTSVKFNGVTATFTIANDGRINAVVPATATTGKISVTNAVGTTVSSTDFTVTGQGPSITSFSPTSGPSGTVVTITGTGFTNVLTVEFDGRNASFTVNSPTQITATIPNNATTGKITVTTTTAAITSASDFTVVGVPTISSLAPAAAPIGDIIVINGDNFTGSTSVKFNGVSATTFTVDNDGKISVTVPVGASTGKVAVTNRAGPATSAGDFTVLPPKPIVTSISPGSGKAGTEVTITGQNFTGATTVTFNGTAATFVVDSPTQIRAVVPLGATTGKVAVTSPSGTGQSVADFIVPVVHPRTVSLGLKKHIIAAGAITVADGFAGCFQERSVRIQKRRDGRWRTVGTATTNLAGGYSIKLPDRTGKYRARAPKASSATDICPKATSSVVRHRH
jgi:hypothetical protein